eukprot:gene31143-6283_t
MYLTATGDDYDTLHLRADNNTHVVALELLLLLLLLEMSEDVYREGVPWLMTGKATSGGKPFSSQIKVKVAAEELSCEIRGCRDARESRKRGKRLVNNAKTIDEFVAAAGCAARIATTAKGGTRRDKSKEAKFTNPYLVKKFVEGKASIHVVRVEKSTNWNFAIVSVASQEDKVGAVLSR